MTVEFLAYVDGPGTEGYYVLANQQPWCRVLAPGNTILRGPYHTRREAERELAELQKAEAPNG